jgi:hypothetical protein
MGINAPFARALAFRIDGHDNTLTPKGLGSGIDQRRLFDRSGVDAHFVGPGVQHQAHVIDRANAAADGERDETVRGGAMHHIRHGRAVVRRCGDIEKDQFIGLLGIVGHRAFDRITGIDQIDEIDPLYHPTSGDIEAGNDAFCEHAANAMPKTPFWQAMIYREKN